MPSSAVRQSPGGCQCGDLPRLCVGVFTCFHCPETGTTIRIFAAGTDDELDPSVTAEDDRACFSLPPGTYDVKASKSGLDGEALGVVIPDDGTEEVDVDIALGTSSDLTVSTLVSGTPSVIATLFRIGTCLYESAQCVNNAMDIFLDASVYPPVLTAVNHPGCPACQRTCGVTGCTTINFVPSSSNCTSLEFSTPGTTCRVTSNNFTQTLSGFRVS